MSHMIDFACVDEDKAPGANGFSLARASGCVGVQIRAEYDFGSQTILDADWMRDHDAAVQAGLKVGPYLITNWRDGFEPEARVDKFYKLVGDLNPKYNLVPAFDIEFPAGIVGTRHTRADIMALIRRYHKSLKETFGVDPELYFSGRVWNTDDTDTLGNPPAPDLVDCSPWVAWYPLQRRVKPVLDISPSVGIGKYGAPKPWGWAFKHQFQGDAWPYPGIGQCDISRVIVIAYGMQGPAVSWAQRRLLAWVKIHAADHPDWAGLPWPKPEMFDDQMTALVKLFQTTNGLTADGSIGLDTHTALNWIKV